jgi:hypothetical protein
MGERFMTDSTTAQRRDWTPMVVTRVGNLSDVMQTKSGPHCDPSPVHVNKRGNGPPHC